MYELTYKYYKDFIQEKWPSDLLNVIHKPTIRQAIYDFLFLIYCNYVSILHHFRDIITYFLQVDLLWQRDRATRLSV